MHPEAAAGLINCWQAAVDPKEPVPISGIMLATHPKNDDERTALEHAQDWQRIAGTLCIIFLAVALLAFWAAQAGYAVFGTIAFFAVLAGAMSGVAAFLSGVRAIQLSRAGRKR